MRSVIVNRILLTLYMMIICLSSVYLYVTHNKLFLAGITAVLAIVFFVLSKYIFRFLKSLSIKRTDEVSARSRGIVFAVSALGCLVILLIWFTAYFPGSYGDDIISQLGQAYTGRYDSWHPVWHTLLFFTFPLKLTGKVWSIVLFQMVYFALATGYMCMVVYRYAGTGWAAGVWAYLCLNPITGYILLFPFKDVAFAIFCMIAMTMAAEIYFTRGIRCGIGRSILIGVVMAHATLFRYNGILFTGFLLLILILYTDKRKWVIMAVSFALTYLIVSGPVYDMMGVVKSETETVQKVGLPMSVIGNAVKETPDIIDEDTREFAYSYSPAEVWEERYSRGNFNLMKYGGVYNPDIIEETPVLDIVKMAAGCVVDSPQASFDAVFALTDFVYGLDLQDKADIDIAVNTIIDNDYGLEPAGNGTLAAILERYYSIIKLKGYNFPRKLGFALLAVVSVVLANLKWFSCNSLKRVILCVPILAYDFGTMLLLSGHDARFFYLSFAVCPLVFIIVEYDKITD